MAVCEICKQIEKGFPASKIYYYDRLCIIIDEDAHTIKAVSINHFAPNIDEEKWIKLQLEIICKRKWGKEYNISKDMYAHPIWFARVASNRIVKKNWKTYSPRNICGDEKLEG